MVVDSWPELDRVRACLAAGADPDEDIPGWGPALHVAAEYGSPEVVAELARLVADVDAQLEDVDSEYDGRTALWVAVHSGKLDNARALAAAGADPWRPMMSGWSPGRLSLASREPGLFPAPAGAEGLTTAESAAVGEAHRLIDALGDLLDEGLSLCCVAGVDAAEAVRRLDATTVQAGDARADEMVHDDALLTVGVTDVPGGCVVSQSWGYGASTPLVSRLLSAGTVCYAMYANPKSGNQGSIARDGVVTGSDLHPGGGWSSPDDPPEEILRTYLYQHKAVAYCCGFAGVAPTDARPFTGPPDIWARLPVRDYWSPTG